MHTATAADEGYTESLLNIATGHSGTPKDLIYNFALQMCCRVLIIYGLH